MRFTVSCAIKKQFEKRKTNNSTDKQARFEFKKINVELEYSSWMYKLGVWGWGFVQSQEGGHQQKSQGSIYLSIYLSQSWFKLISLKNRRKIVSIKLDNKRIKSIFWNESTDQ